MPQPAANLVPKEEYWGFVQRDIPPPHLRALASNIVAADNNVLDDNLKKSVLSFLSGDLVGQWSDYWITIINTLGLGFVTQGDNKFHKTDLADFIAGGGNLTEFYLLWTLLFQFPFAETKHKEYKEKNIVINPGQILIEALVQLHYISKTTGNKQPFRETYLTPEEIVLVLMKSKSNDSYECLEKVNTIYNNRVASFDYTSIMVTGHDSIINNFTTRARLYLEKSGLIKFSSDKSIRIQDWKTLSQCQNFLSYRKPGKPISIEHEERDRISFFTETFNHTTEPAEFFKNVHSSDQLINESTLEPDEVTAMHRLLSNSGKFFSEDFIERFLLSAKAKPFIILSGVSGMGKSLLPKALMEILNNVNCRPIAVSPDWTDNSDMLGYFDTNGKFVAGEFTNVVRDASRNLHLPYFLILDEMNLAKVEYYFAQVLSVMESRFFDRLTGKCGYRDHLFNVGVRKRLESSSFVDEQELSLLKIPNNLVIVGTVNIDESTHPFSKKVLDRANVLEFSSISLMVGVGGLSSSTSSISILPNTRNFVGQITNISELYKHWSLNQVLQSKHDFNSYVQKWISELERFNAILEPHQLNFGLRMRDEVCIYLYYAALRNIDTTSATWDNKYLDHQLIQKVLTRLEGEEGEIEKTLLELFKLCLLDSTAIQDYQAVLNYSNTKDSNVKYPLAATKLKNMLHNIVSLRKPMVSFWTS
jgi:hypothetical protein